MLTSECKRGDEMSPNTAEKNGGKIVKCTARAEKIDESSGAWRVLKFLRDDWQRRQPVFNAQFLICRVSSPSMAGVAELRNVFPWTCPLISSTYQRPSRPATGLRGDGKGQQAVSLSEGLLARAGHEAKSLSGRNAGGMNSQ